MRNSLYVLITLLLFGSCKPSFESAPAPVEPLNFTVAPDSVRLNPYGYTPLAARLSFTTPVVGRTFIRVRGKHGRLTHVEHLFKDKGTNHAVPVIGLYPNYTNTVDVRVLSDAGDTLARSSLTIQTGDLPPTVPQTISTTTFDETRVVPGLVLISSYVPVGTATPSTPYFVDAYGDVRWVLDYRQHSGLKTLNYDDGIERLRNGNFFFGDITTAHVYEVDLLGQVVHKWNLSGYLFHHNVIEKPNGNLVLTASKPGSTKANGTTTIDDYVIEVDRQTGKLATEWDLKESLDENRTALASSPYVTAQDWFHGNSVEYDSTDNTIIVSGRHQGVVKLDYNNRVKWILAAHRGWTTNRRGEDLRPFLLKPVDASGTMITDTAVLNGSKVALDFEWNWYQHSPIFLPSGDLMLFDNGDIREYNPNADRYSRAVSYKIDPVKMTVQQTWTYGKERGLATYSQIISSVQFLPSSNHVLFGPGYNVANSGGKGGKVVEIDYNSRTAVWELSISTATGFGFHRAKKMSAYPARL